MPNNTEVSAETINQQVESPTLQFHRIIEPAGRATQEQFSFTNHASLVDERLVQVANDQHLTEVQHLTTTLPNGTVIEQFGAGSAGFNDLNSVHRTVIDGDTTVTHFNSNAL